MHNIHKTKTDHKSLSLRIFCFFLYLAAILFIQVKRLCNFGRGHYEEHFCEIILNLD